MNESHDYVSKKNTELIEYLTNKFKSEFSDFRKLYLFGSRVKGNFDPESDYDIVVIFDKNNREKRLRIYGIVGEAQYIFDVIIDVNILTEEEFRYNPFFYEEVTKYGLVYE
jgi:predicted nucleotidyltransferase